MLAVSDLPVLGFDTDALNLVMHNYPGQMSAEDDDSDGVDTAQIESEIDEMLDQDRERTEQIIEALKDKIDMVDDDRSYAPRWLRTTMP